MPERGRRGTCGPVRWSTDGGTATVTVTDSPDPWQLPGIALSLADHLASPAVQGVVCEGPALHAADLAVVDLLARLQLLADAWELALRVRGTPRLSELVRLVGLDGSLSCTAWWPAEPPDGSDADQR